MDHPHPPTPANTFFPQFYAVSCSSATACTAVGTSFPITPPPPSGYGEGIETLAERYAG